MLLEKIKEHFLHMKQHTEIYTCPSIEQVAKLDNGFNIVFQQVWDKLLNEKLSLKFNELDGTRFSIHVCITKKGNFSQRSHPQEIHQVGLVLPW